MTSLEGPGPFDGVDPDTLTREEWHRRYKEWLDRKRAESLAKHGPLRPGDISEVKKRDISGNADARGMTDYYLARAQAEAQAKAEQEARAQRDDQEPQP